MSSIKTAPESPAIRNFFDSIAFRYDFLNHLLSFNVDRHWRRQAEELGINPEELVHRVDDLANQLVDHLSEVERSMTEAGLTHPLIHRLAARLTVRAKACRKVLRS